MAKDFENIGHKNIELLRFYLNKDLSKIDKKLITNDNNFLGYFFASLVDILIVLIFEDYFTCVPLCWKIGFVIALMLLFGVISKIIILLKNWWDQTKKLQGKDKYLPESIQEVVDNFDNIACDGLLICENYCQRYIETEKDYLRDFYLYEIIHHLDKALNICDSICAEQETYASSNHDGLIDIYRLKNFLQFSQEIYNFLGKITQNIEQKDGLGGSIKNLDVILDRIKNKIK